MSRTILARLLGSGVVVLTGASIIAWEFGWRFSADPADWAVWISAVSTAALVVLTAFYVRFTQVLMRTALSAAEAAVAQSEAAADAAIHAQHAARAAIEQAKAATDAVNIGREVWRIDRLEAYSKFAEQLRQMADLLRAWSSDVERARTAPITVTTERHSGRAVTLTRLVASLVPPANAPWVYEHVATAFDAQVPRIAELAEYIDRGVADGDERRQALWTLGFLIRNVAQAVVTTLGATEFEVGAIAAASVPAASLFVGGVPGADQSRKT